MITISVRTDEDREAIARAVEDGSLAAALGVPFEVVRDSAGPGGSGGIHGFAIGSGGTGATYGCGPGGGSGVLHGDTIGNGGGSGSGR